MSAKHHITPIDSEIVMADDEFIVSKTDLKGNIIYANRTFMEMALLTEQQLLNKPHNIIRHPDMPQGVFKFMWQIIQQQQEFFGFVKNIATDGRYYWVFANVTPEYTPTGKLVGFLSVRRKPPTSAINVISPIYKEMIRIESLASSSHEAQNQSIAYLQDQLAQLNVDYQTLVINLFNETSWEEA